MYTRYAQQGRIRAWVNLVIMPPENTRPNASILCQKGSKLMKISLLLGSALIHPIIFLYFKALSRGNQSSAILYHEHGIDTCSTYLGIITFFTKVQCCWKG